MLPIIPLPKSTRAVNSQPAVGPVQRLVLPPTQPKPVSAACHFNLQCAYGPGFGIGELLVWVRKDGIIEIVECFVPFGLEAPTFTTPCDNMSVYVEPEELMDESGEFKVMQVHRDAVTRVAHVQMKESGSDCYWLPMKKIAHLMVVRKANVQQMIGGFADVWLKYAGAVTKPVALASHKFVPAPPRDPEYRQHGGRYQHTVMQDVNPAAVKRAVYRR